MKLEVESNDTNDLLRLLYGALGVLLITTQVLGELMLYISFTFALKCYFDDSWS